VRLTRLAANHEDPGRSTQQKAFKAPSPVTPTTMLIGSNQSKKDNQEGIRMPKPDVKWEVGSSRSALLATVEMGLLLAWLWGFASV